MLSGEVNDIETEDGMKAPEAGPKPGNDKVNGKPSPTNGSSTAGALGSNNDAGWLVADM